MLILNKQKNIMKFMKYIALIFTFIFSMNSFADYKVIISPMMKLEGVWQYTDTEYGSWFDVGNLINCDGIWSPSTSTVASGKSFTQDQDCEQKQERKVFDVEEFSVTKETRRIQKENEERTVAKNKSRIATGTKVVRTGYCHYEHSPYSSTDSFYKYINMKTGTNRLVFRFNSVNGKEGLYLNYSNWFATKDAPTASDPYFYGGDAYWVGSYVETRNGYQYYKICKER